MQSSCPSLQVALRLKAQRHWGTAITPADPCFGLVQRPRLVRPYTLGYGWQGVSGLPPYLASSVEQLRPIREGHRDDMKIVGLLALPTCFEISALTESYLMIHSGRFAGHLLRLESNDSAKTEKFLKSTPHIPAKLVLPPQSI